jgi:(1->4)-alpha-D-glucan 1-alpha-D-glucosylmutase
MSEFSPNGPVPRASYRLQLNKDFTFADVERIAPYLGRLGVSHAYLSPILKARAGSTHGYDTVDHTQINPELGTMEDFRSMAKRLRDEGLGIILDIVPNHMGVGGADNRLWLDLLEWGLDSRYADWFDVDWSPAEPSLKNKVLVPFLGSSFGDAVAEGRLTLRFDAEEGSFAAWAEDTHKMPLDPRHYGHILGRVPSLTSLAEQFSTLNGPDEAHALKSALTRVDASAVEDAVAKLNAPAAREELRDLFERQNWRAARYSVAADDINYRRFFIVSDLGAIRIERDDVFEHAHRLIFQLVEEGLVDGLRVDHIDGLYDPKGYTKRLRQQCPKPVYLVVEKILAEDEQLRRDWQVDGTTGYEFANNAVQLAVDPLAETALSQLYSEFTGQKLSLPAIEREAKFEIIDLEMAAELDSLTKRLRAIASQHPSTADLTRNGLRSALRLLVASMDVYRTYVDTDGASDEDISNLDRALSRARSIGPTLDPALFDFLRKVASGELAGEVHYDAEMVTNRAMRLQQFTGPAMAKGLEDTALYRYNRLIALSDVGQKPDQFGVSVERFHEFNSQRAEAYPLGMLTSSSHDTKRGEDVRARIAALTNMVDAWTEAVHRWQDWLGEAGAAIDANDLYYFLQQVVGSWPSDLLDGVALDASALASFKERSVAAMTKAVREARVHTHWTAPSEEYEEAVAAVIEMTLDPSTPLFSDLRSFATKLAERGAANGLVSTALKLTVPGMPDIYQGAELHELSMVDPDNRRPVDFALRERLLGDSAPIDLASGWRDGSAKLKTIQELLQLRGDHPALFARGTYEPLAIEGDESGRALAFLRRHEGEALIVAAWLASSPAPSARIVPPPGFAGARWSSVLQKDLIADATDFAGLLGDLPVAVLTVDEPQ